MRQIITTILLLTAICAFAGTSPTEFEANLRTFSASKYRLAQDISLRLHLPLPPQACAFFGATVSNNWESVSNQFEHVKEPGEYGRPIPELRNELWAVIRDTMGIWEVWAGWKQDSDLLRLSYVPVLNAMTNESIYFGGTEYGRFVITMATEIRKTPQIHCITQNALSDSLYSSYLRAAFTNIWTPVQTDIDYALAQYVREVEDGTRARNDDTVILHGHVTKWGVMGVMALHGIISQMIFEHNKQSHSFYVEESYVLDWMYRYLEPQGLILKLNREPSTRLPEEVVSRDRLFWTQYVELLESQPSFGNNAEARKTFSKLRCAIAGIYVYRKMYEEAEAAFRQAIRLSPASPEASFRIAEIYVGQGRFTDAIRVIDDYLKVHTPYGDERASAYRAQLLDRMQTETLHDTALPRRP